MALRIKWLIAGCVVALIGVSRSWPAPSAVREDAPTTVASTYGCIDRLRALLHVRRCTQPAVLARRVRAASRLPVFVDVVKVLGMSIW